MKKQNKHKPKTKTIKELAGAFDQQLQAKLPITQLPNGSIVYKDFLVKEIANGNWGVFNIKNKDLIEQFFLKTCALMAAKAYNNTQLEKYFEIKRLDNRYWASHCDTMIYRNNIKTAKDFDRYLILLNKLEHSDAQAKHYQDAISQMFKWSFV
jgi:hypothetical protein